MKKSVALYAVICSAAFFASCGKSDPNSPGIEFMPDMYRSPGLEPNLGYYNGKDTVSGNMMPVPGSIARGYLPYPYANDSAGYEEAGRFLKSPFGPEVVEDGKVLYGKFCVHCHGTNGGGDGKMVQNEKFPPPPAYSSVQLKDLPEGKMFHSVSYGKGLMGPHAPLLTQTERWKIIEYVQTLQKPGGATAVSDTASVKQDSVNAGTTPAKK